MGQVDKTKQPKVVIKNKPVSSEARQIWLAFRDVPTHSKRALIHAWKERSKNEQ